MRVDSAEKSFQLKLVLNAILVVPHLHWVHVLYTVIISLYSNNLDVLGRELRVTD